MRSDRVVIIGAGMGGLVAALELAARGVAVTVLERADGPGGKMREVRPGGAPIDAGPTVLTMRWIFEAIFSAAGASLDAHLGLKPAQILARHAWSETERLDLHADLERSVEAIGELAGAAEGRRYREFCARARGIYQTLDRPFMQSSRPNVLTLIRRVGPNRLGDLWRISPFVTLWRALGQHFHDPRLQQLFGRYATYMGSSPFMAPATLMLIAHVEKEGVWLVDGGMHRIAQALVHLAGRLGADFRFGTEVREVMVDGGRVSRVELTDGERLEADAVIVNADVAAISRGLLGSDIARAAPRVPQRARSLSAVTWNLLAQTEGFPLLRHTVFFSRDYAAEFNDIFRRARLPEEPTVYVCAQDRADRDGTAPEGPERLLCLVNAPANGDFHLFDSSEIEQCEQRTFALLKRCGLHVQRRPEASVVTTPAEFDRLFPATGGALYGRASHGWMASFRRPGSRTRIPGLYLAGGSTHPGPGVPMAALSGRLAAASLIEDLASTSQWLPAAMPGGTSTR